MPYFKSGEKYSFKFHPLYMTRLILSNLFKFFLDIITESRKMIYFDVNNIMLPLINDTIDFTIDFRIDNFS